MKTTLKIFICAVLCGAAYSAFATPVPNGSTTLAFKDACGGNLVTSVGLNGAGTPDVYIETTTISSVGQPYIDQGRVQLEIAVDLLGNPTSVALVNHWVRIDTAAGGGLHPTSGVCCFPVDLDGLSSLGVGVNNVTCSTPLVGFRAHYITGGGMTHVDTHLSNSADLTINCSACGTSTSLTIGIKLTSGQGSPTPGYGGCWTYRITVQNCTGSDLTGVKVQGGTAGWVNTTSAIADLAPAAAIKLNNKNQVITWIGDLMNGQSVNIDVTVCGSIKPSQVCTPCDQLDTPVAGSVLYLSGPWSAAYTDPVTLLPAKTDYTGRVSLTVACTVCP
jgi:hypothetical protein